MNLRIKIMLLLLSCSNITFSQNITKMDTIKWSNYKLIIELPKNNRVHVDSYEEGFFQTISCYLDSAIITIHSGAMVNLPLIDLTKYSITSEFILDNDIRILRGCYKYEKNGVKRYRYFREENFKKHEISIMYENVDESKLIFYDHILDNIKVIRTE